VHLVLPLSDRRRGHDQDSADIPTKHQLLDVQPAMIVLPAGIIRQAEAQRLPGKHLAIDSDDLVRKWFDQTEMHRETGIEQVSETDSAGLGNEPEKSSITVEGPGSPLPVERQLSFLRAVNDLFIDPASVGSERKHDASRTCHRVATTVTDSPGTMPRTTAPGVSSSSVATLVTSRPRPFYTLDATAFRSRTTQEAPGQQHGLVESGPARVTLDELPLSRHKVVL